MTERTRLTVVMTTEKASTQLRDDIVNSGGEIDSVGTRRALDGSAGEWVIVALVALRVFREVCTQLLEYVRTKQIAAIKVDDLEIYKPTEAQVDEIIRFYIELKSSGTADPPLDTTEKQVLPRESPSA